MASLIALLPTILTLLGYALKWYGASEETLTAYKKLVEQSAKDNLISVTTKDKLLTQREKILARMKEKEEANKPPVT
jgi:hypothetical protein